MQPLLECNAKCKLLILCYTGIVVEIEKNKKQTYDKAELSTGAE